MLGKNNIFTLPNVLSLSRIPLGLIFAYGLWARNFTVIAVSAILAGLSDTADGNAARYWNKVTRLGAELDIICNKFFMLCAVVALILAKYAPAWQIVLLGLKDIVMVAASAVMYLGGKFAWKKVEAKAWGKAATALQFISLAALIVLPKLFPYLLALTLIATVFTFYQYRSRML